MIRAAHFLAGTLQALRPPAELALSDWADKYFYLSPESAAEPGKWHTIPYQKGIMDAITDPTIEQITVMKSARVGYTKVIDAAIAYFMHQDPCPIMVVQPTVEDAEGFSKEEIAPMLRDVPVLAAITNEPTTRVSGSTILAKNFPGGSLSMVGANSGRGFRRVSRRVVIFDEVDGYPPSAGTEGDQIKLGIRRSEYYWNRKIIAGSTPLIAGKSRIEDLFLVGDQRRYYVPCPQCGHMDILVFSKREDGRGHYMQWPAGQPENAYLVCSENGCVIEERDKRNMIYAGEWRADGPVSGHASFHIWSGYSLSPNASWGQLAAEFVEANAKGPEILKTFVNTVLGETWREKGEAPEWERLYNRREEYEIGSVPSDRVVLLTAGVDVQKDRLVYEVVGWATNKESWSIEAGILHGDSASDETWAQLDALLNRSFHAADGRVFSIGMMAVDSGYNTQTVYNWARRYPMSRVMAVKGVSTGRTLVEPSSAVDILINGKRHQRGYRVTPVYGAIAKQELYGWLGLRQPEQGANHSAGWCHFPEYAEEYFKQVTAEHLVSVRDRKGRTVTEWHVIPGRENHWLDCRVYARAAASVKGLDRFKQAAPALPPPLPSATPAPPPPPPRPAKPPMSPGNWLKGRAKGAPKGGWLGKRR